MNEYVCRGNHLLITLFLTLRLVLRVTSFLDVLSAESYSGEFIRISNQWIGIIYTSFSIIFGSRSEIMHSTDHETGEVTLTKQCQPTEIDMETGESDSNIGTAPTLRKRTFVIPKKLIHTPKSQKRKLRCMNNIDNYTLFKKEEVINLQEVNCIRFMVNGIAQSSNLFFIFFFKGNHFGIECNQPSSIFAANHVCVFPFLRRTNGIRWNLLACMGA